MCVCVCVYICSSSSSSSSLSLSRWTRVSMAPYRKKKKGWRKKCVRVTEDSDNSLHAMDSWLHRCIEEFGRGVSCGRGVPPYGNPMVIPIKALTERHWCLIFFKLKDYWKTHLTSKLRTSNTMTEHWLFVRLKKQHRTMGKWIMKDQWRMCSVHAYLC